MVRVGASWEVGGDQFDFELEVLVICETGEPKVGGAARSKPVSGLGWWRSAGRRGAELAGEAGPLVGVREGLGQMDHDAAH